MAKLELKGCLKHKVLYTVECKWCKQESCKHERDQNFSYKNIFGITAFCIKCDKELFS